MSLAKYILCGLSIRERSGMNRLLGPRGWLPDPGGELTDPHLMAKIILIALDIVAVSHS